jgi:hypothetical protein
MLRSFVFLVLFLGFFSNCTFIQQVSSNKSEAFTQPYSRVFIVSEAPHLMSWNERWIHAVQNGLVQKMEQASVQVMNEPFNALSLTSPAQLEEKINTFAPQAVLKLTMDILHGRTGGDYVFIVTLEDRTQRIPVWRGRVEVWGDNSPKELGPSVAAKLFYKMRLDGVLQSAITPVK